MSNVVSFRKPTAPTPHRKVAAPGSKTLFLHVKSATLIVHLAAPHRAEPVLGQRV